MKTNVSSVKVPNLPELLGIQQKIATSISNGSTADEIFVQLRSERTWSGPCPLAYLQVGFHYLAFPLLVLLPIFVFFRLQGDPHGRTRMPTIAIFGMVNVLFTFYWFATFAQPGDFYAKRFWVAALFISTITIIATGRKVALNETSDFLFIDRLVEAFIDPLFKKASGITRMNLTRGAFMVILLTLDIFILGALGIAIASIGACIFCCKLFAASAAKNAPSSETRTRRQLLVFLVGFATTALAIAYFQLFRWERVWHIAFYYFYWGIVAGFLWKELKSIRTRYSRRERIFVWALRACVLSGFYYMGILAFSYGVYPQIPVAKGGGNYSHAVDVRLYVGSDTTHSKQQTDRCQTSEIRQSDFNNNPQDAHSVTLNNICYV